MKRGMSEDSVKEEGSGMKDMFLRENRESFYGDHFSPAIVLVSQQLAPSSLYFLQGQFC